MVSLKNIRKVVFIPVACGLHHSSLRNLKWALGLYYLVPRRTVL